MFKKYSYIYLVFFYEIKTTTLQINESPNPSIPREMALQNQKRRGILYFLAALELSWIIFRKSEIGKKSRYVM